MCGIHGKDRGLPHTRSGPRPNRTVVGTVYQLALLPLNQPIVEPKRFEILSPEGDSGLFIATGPWADDHITVGLQPEGDLKLVHRSIGAAEVWRHDPASLQTEVDSFLANDVAEVDWKEVMHDVRHPRPC